MKNICFVTGTRADYGILSTAMKLFQNDKEINFSLIVTGMHLSDDYGKTIDTIIADGFPVTKKIDILFSSRSRVSVAKSLGLATMGIAEALEELKPDLLVILGDRFEILGAAQAAMVLNIPIAHIHGGELTTGAMDDSIRHAITKMSHLHFVSTEDYKKRVIQLGENPAYVFNVGAPGIDKIKQIDLLSLSQLKKDLKLEDLDQYFVVTYHPVTRKSEGGLSEFKHVLNALVPYLDKYKFVFTMPNSDPDSNEFDKMIKDFCLEHEQSWFHSLGSLKYFSLIQHSCGVIGNSSSGLLEVPFFNVPTINIGDRQTGRVSGPSVINVEGTQEAVAKAISLAITMKGKDFRSGHLYGSGGGSQKIYEIIKKIPDYKTLLNKGFHNLE